MSSGYWVVAKTKPLKELWAAENVSRQGFQYYLPQLPPITVVTKHKKAAPTQKRQFLFPRYLFVWTEGPWRCLLGTFGITTLIMNGESPAVLPTAEVDRMRAREDARGLIRLPSAPAAARFKAGDLVRINSGPFSGYTGIYDSATDSDRVRVLLDYLGQRTRVLIGEEFLEEVYG